MLLDIGKKKKLNQLTAEYKSLRNHTSNDAHEIKKNIDLLSSEIRDLENHKEEHEYYLKSSSYIIPSYSNVMVE